MDLGLSNSRILVVDDEEWNVDLLIAVLSENGFIVDYSSSAEEAISNLREKWMGEKILYDILISDFYMEDGDGQEFFWMIDGYFGSDPLHCHIKNFKSFKEAKKSPYCYTGLIEVLENCFVNCNEYNRFVKDYMERNTLRILFSGRFNREMMADPILSERVIIIQKNPDSLDKRCETAVLECLRDKGFLREDDVLSADYEIQDLKRQPLFCGFYENSDY